jgi:hypothetical protein
MCKVSSGSVYSPDLSQMLWLTQCNKLLLIPFTVTIIQFFSISQDVFQTLWSCGNPEGRSRAVKVETNGHAVLPNINKKVPWIHCPYDISGLSLWYTELPRKNGVAEVNSKITMIKTCYLSQNNVSTTVIMGVHWPPAYSGPLYTGRPCIKQYW